MPQTTGTIQKIEPTYINPATGQVTGGRISKPVPIVSYGSNTYGAPQGVTFEYPNTTSIPKQIPTTSKPVITTPSIPQPTPNTNQGIDKNTLTQKALDIAKQQDKYLTPQEARYLADINSRDVSVRAIQSYIAERDAGIKQQLINQKITTSPEEYLKINYPIQTETGTKLDIPKPTGNIVYSSNKNIPFNVDKNYLGTVTARTEQPYSESNLAKVVNPILKFASGEYIWQQKLFPKEKSMWFKAGYSSEAEYNAAGLEKIPGKQVFNLLGSGIVKVSEKIIGQPVQPEIRQQLTRGLGTALLVSFISPLASRAVTSESEYTYNVITGKFIKKGQVSVPQTIGSGNADLDAYTIKFERAYAGEGEKGVQALIIKYQKIIQSQTTPEKKELAIKNMNLILGDLARKGIIKSSIIDTNTGKIIADIKPVEKVQLFKFNEVKTPITITSEGGVVPKSKPIKVISVGAAELTQTPNIILTSSFAGSQYGIPISNKQIQLQLPKVSNAYFPNARLYLPNTKSEILPMLNAKPTEINLESPVTIINTKEKSLSLLSLNTKSLSNVLSKTEQQTNQQSKSLTKQQSRELLLQISTLLSLSKTRQLTKQITKQKPAEKDGTGEDIIKKKKINFFGIPSREPGKIKSLISGLGNEEYEAFTRKKGKEVSLGIFKSLKTAEEKAKIEVLGTLRASAVIKKVSTGEKVPFKLGAGFTPSKKEPLRQVQVRGTRLSSGGERREIKASKGAGKFLR